MEDDKRHVRLVLEIAVMILFVAAVNFLKLDYNMYIGTLIGAAFITGYHIKRYNSMLFCGIVIFIISFQNFLKAIPIIGETIAASLMFITIGIFLLFLAKKKHIDNFPLPEYFLIWCGVYILLLSLPICKKNAAAMFFIIVGSGFLSSHFLGKKRAGKWVVFISIIAFAVAAFLML